MKRYVIIGNGVAGASALEQIRARDKDGSVTVFTRETHPFYYRPRLPEYMAGEMPLEKFTMHPLSKYEQWNVDLRLGENVVAIDQIKKEITGEKSGPVPYDELLLASGSNCFVPPVEGSARSGVFTLRTLEDADAIVAAAKKTGSAALVGGGLLGLEAGHALVKLGLKVEVIELAGRLLPRQMDEQGAAILQDLLAGMGFSFRLNAQVKEITGVAGGDKAAEAGGVVFADGGSIPCALVLFSAGVRPNLELAAPAGIETGKAIKVDEYMRTNVPGIWAAGDAAEYNGQPCGLWTVAMAQGRAAGASMAGELTAYVPQPPGTSLKVAGISLSSAGNIDAEEKLTAKRFVRAGGVQDSGGTKNSVYRKIVLEDDVIKGFIFLGSAAGVRECTAAMNQGRRLGKLAEELDREDFDFSRIG
jgi:nitrite reductase (NADH) large subunit